MKLSGKLLRRIRINLMLSLFTRLKSSKTKPQQHLRLLFHENKQINYFSFALTMKTETKTEKKQKNKTKILHQMKFIARHQ